MKRCAVAETIDVVEVTRPEAAGVKPHQARPRTGCVWDVDPHKDRRVRRHEQIGDGGKRARRQQGGVVCGPRLAQNRQVVAVLLRDGETAEERGRLSIDRAGFVRHQRRTPVGTDVGPPDRDRTGERDGAGNGEREGRSKRLVMARRWRRGRAARKASGQVVRIGPVRVCAMWHTGWRRRSWARS